MQRIDQQCISSGVPALELMERAGQAVFEELCSWLSSRKLSNARIVVLCGSGNNGGDGLVLSRLLLQSGALPKTVLCACERYSEECLAELSRYVVSGGEVVFIDKAPAPLSGLKHSLMSARDLYYTIEQSEVVVDALLGTGQKNAPHGQAAALIGVLNQALQREENRPLVISLDVPSGMNATTGAVYDPAVTADLTVSLELAKRGMFQYPARAHCGEISVAPLGINSTASVEYNFVHAEMAAGLLVRPGDYHKGRAGKIYVLGGSRCMPGAPVLAASAALYAGAGLVTMAALPAARAVNIPPEVMLDFPQSSTAACFGANGLRKIIKKLAEEDCLVLGPGIGREAPTAKLVSGLLKWISQERFPALIDADALNILATQKSFPDLSSCVLTPHPGEAARLLKCSVDQVQQDRFSAVKKLHEMTGAVCLLKGPGTLVYFNKQGFLNPTGNPSMATAGCGDVLSGIIGAFMTQFRHEPKAALLAACAGVYLHGLAGDLLSPAPLVASDLIKRIPEAFLFFTRASHAS